MSSKSKQSREDQKVYWEEKLNQRISVLTEKGLDPTGIAKDGAVKQLRAKLRETHARLKAIADLEKKAEEMANLREEKKAAATQEASKKKKAAKEEAAPEMSKRQQKKKKKLEEKQKPDADQG